MADRIQKDQWPKTPKVPDRGAAERVRARIRARKARVEKTTGEGRPRAICPTCGELAVTTAFFAGVPAGRFGLFCERCGWSD